jgi:hypothetical protein
VPKYVVTGTRPQFGHRPGEEFEADLPEAMAQRAIDRGGIALAKDGDGLDAKTREELNELAGIAGVASPEKLGTKAEVIEAIHAATEGPDQSGSNQKKEE